MAALRKVRRFMWGELPESKAERNLLLKIDWFILSYCCLMYFSNYNLMLQVVPPRIWLPTMQIVWGVLTFCTSAVTSVQQIFVIRFFQGIAESSTFVGTHYILGSWYKSGELGKRSGIFTSSGLMGTLFSGILQAAVYTNLNGRAGRSGWRWLFIIDGIITIPIALYGFAMFPDVPTTTKAFYLSEEERLLSCERLESDKDRDIGHGYLNWSLVKKLLGNWRWYGCSLLFAISGETESFGSNNLMGQWMKAIGGFTVPQIDNYPSGMTAFAITSTLVCATWTDATKSRARWPVLVYMCICTITASIILLVWHVPVGAKFFAWYLAGASYAGQATTFAWANQICADDHAARGVVLASMNMWNNVINAWWPLVFYPATDAPRFTKGMWAMIGTSIATLGVTWAAWYLERREKRMKARRDEAGDGEKRDVRGSQKVDEKTAGRSEEKSGNGRKS
ncbi:MFS general substrate transporter [Ganoderma sinense ZZ0214-1]|uniref:MFS general substrate transporter n=1 Tax=Ganoderma sinense ZZ0214-1 TaxID=1077348 RepID=A0A2G8STL9_9APHY|nr:MFS general substrate transporter [Ganoderma sinense ZZ0214-1]